MENENKRDIWMQDWKLSRLDEHTGHIIFDDILTINYRKRWYHNLDHALRCRNKLLSVGPTYCSELILAAWFHDIIYVPGAKDNEARSGQLAYHWIYTAADLAKSKDPTLSLIPNAENVQRLIEVTGSLDPANFHEQLIIDADYAILGAPREEYIDYAHKVAKEYGCNMKDDVWRVGRKAFLEGLLARDRIYFTDEFGKIFEVPARWNIKAELELLTTP